jgi:FMN phosphatase YigB (HAD superfamily)
MPDNPRVTAVCFDLGGVHVKLAGSWAEALRWAGFGDSPDPKHAARVHSLETYNAHELGLISDADYLEALRAYLGLATADEALQAHLWVLGEPFPGTHDLVLQVQAAGLRTGCLSNTEEHHWRRMTGGYYPAVTEIEVKAASHLLRARKPDRAIFEAFERLSGFERNSTVYFDDSLMHVEGARAFGWHAFQVDPTGDTAAQMCRALQDLGIRVH